MVQFFTIKIVSMQLLVFLFPTKDIQMSPWMDYFKLVIFIPVL